MRCLARGCTRTWMFKYWRRDSNRMGETIASRYLKGVFSLLRVGSIAAPLSGIRENSTSPAARAKSIRRVSWGVSHLRTRSNTDHRQNILPDRFERRRLDTVDIRFNTRREWVVFFLRAGGSGPGDPRGYCAGLWCTSGAKSIYLATVSQRASKTNK